MVWECTEHLGAYKGFECSNDKVNDEPAGCTTDLSGFEANVGCPGYSEPCTSDAPVCTTDEPVCTTDLSGFEANVGCPGYSEPCTTDVPECTTDVPECPGDFPCTGFLANDGCPGYYANTCSTERTAEDASYNSNEYAAEKSSDYGGYNSGYKADEPTVCTAHLAEHLADYFSVHVPPCTAFELPESPEFEPYAGQYPTLTIPTYEEYAGQFPAGQLPTYEEYQKQFPELTLERYKEYGKEYPGLGEMFELSEAGIRQLMNSTGLPVEELMRAYSAEEKTLLDEYLPQLREQWSARGLLRSGGTVKQELKAVGESARKMATTRAELEKESYILKQQSLQAGIGLAMQHAGMGQTVSAEAFRVGQQEYQKAHDSAIDAGKSEYQAKVAGYNAQIDEHIRQFASSVEAEKFVQGIEERAFQASREEWQKVFDSQVAKGLTEFEAEQAAYNAGQAEYARIQQLEFDKWETEYVEEMKKYLMELGFSAQQAQAAAQGWGGIFGTIIGIIFKSIFGV